MNEKMWKFYATGAIALMLVQAVLTFATAINKDAAEKEVATAINTHNATIAQLVYIEGRQTTILEGLADNMTKALERQQVYMKQQDEVNKKLDEMNLRKQGKNFER